MGSGGLEKEAPKQSRFETLKNYIQKYGKVFVVYYAGAWCLSFIPIYGAIVATDFDTVTTIKDLAGEGSYIYEQADKLNPELINFLLAMEINELGDFVRLPFVVYTTPKVADFFTKKDEGATKA